MTTIKPLKEFNECVQLTIFATDTATDRIQLYKNIIFTDNQKCFFLFLTSYSCLNVYVL